MKILISNDDGIDAPGIKALASALSSLATIYVVAPDRNRSGASNSLTLTRPLYINERQPSWVAVQGTPTDCVHLAVTGLLEKEPPDMVVSGINDGANMGDDVWYSGTVAAAIEGRFLGLPSVAISLSGEGTRQHYATASEVAKLVVQHLMANPLPAGTILNVNVPDVPLKELEGFEVTRLGTRRRAEPTIKQQDPRGRTIYWVGPVGPEEDAGPGTDFHAVRHHKVSITPLSVDLTKYEALDRLAKWVESGLVIE
ncbi:MAG TPA: 5'/3'-nucleotidase SurE [Coxiellaceae bacterium]|nr:5'/3'-nucleotidase SurE [Coxiellaceae bacterium]